jgi:hypothetical protein
MQVWKQKMPIYEDLVDRNFYYRSIEPLCQIIDKAEKYNHQWNEVDTVVNVIVPIMTLLGFGNYALVGKKAAFSQPSPTKHRPDFEVRSFSATLAILEAKPYWAALVGRNSSTDYVTPLDQILTYLDHYGAVFGLLTNGRHWCLLKKLDRESGELHAANADYIGVSFDLVGSFGLIIDHNNVEAFLGMCQVQRLFQSKWPDDRAADYIVETVVRKTGLSNLFLKDFSSRRFWATS